MRPRLGCEPGRLTSGSGQTRSRDKLAGDRLRVRSCCRGRSPQSGEERVGEMFEGLKGLPAIGTPLDVVGDARKLGAGKSSGNETFEFCRSGAAGRGHGWSLV